MNSADLESVDECVSATYRQVLGERVCASDQRRASGESECSSEKESKEQSPIPLADVARWVLKRSSFAMKCRLRSKNQDAGDGYRPNERSSWAGTRPSCLNAASHSLRDQ